MQQLKVKDLFAILEKTRKIYNLTLDELGELNIYLGDDEELNGVHGAYFCQDVDVNKAKGYTFNDINSGRITMEEYCEQSLEQQVKEYNEKQKGLCILIS